MATTEAPPSSSSTIRPWGELFSLSSLSPPFSLSELNYRIPHNLRYFSLNYANIFLIILFLSLVYHPLALVLLFLTTAAWFFFYLSRSEPLVFFDWTIDDRLVLVVLAVVSLLALIWSNVWWNLFVSAAISAVVIGLHAAVRVPEDDVESPYGSLLDSPRGGYSQV